MPAQPSQKLLKARNEPFNEYQSVHLKEDAGVDVEAEIATEGQYTPSAFSFVSLKERWDDAPFWHKAAIVSAATFIGITVVLIIVIATGHDSHQDHTTVTIGPALSGVPAGCLGAPFILVSFHGGQSKNPLKHGRYNGILKYSRNGCLLGPATDDPGTRLRGLYTSHDDQRLYAVAEGSDTEHGNVMMFGSCLDPATKTKMIQRPLLNSALLNSGHSCLNHLYGIDSPDRGKSLYLTSQSSGDVIRVDGTSGGPLGNTSDKCPGLFMNLTSYTVKSDGKIEIDNSHRSASGVRGLCFGSGKMFLPFKYADGIFSTGLESCESTTGCMVNEKNIEHADMVLNLQKGQPPVTNNASSVSGLTRFVSVDVYGSSHQPQRIGGMRGLIKGLDPKLKTMHSTACVVNDNRVYFIVRETKKQNTNDVYSANGVVEYDLYWQTARFFTSDELLRPQDVLILGDSMFVLAAAATPGNNTGQIMEFNLETGKVKGPAAGIVNFASTDRFPDQPEQMVWSPC